MKVLHPRGSCPAIGASLPSPTPPHPSPHVHGECQIPPNVEVSLTMAPPLQRRRLGMHVVAPPCSQLTMVFLPAAIA